MKKNAVFHLLCIIGCLLCGVLLCAAQTSFIPHYLNDAYLVPDLLLCTVVAIGIFAGPVYGSLYGIYAGVLADSVSGFGIFLLPLFYMLCGYAAWVAANILPKRKFPVFLAVGAIALLGRVVIAVIYVILFCGSVPLPDVLRYVCFPLLLGTALVLPAAYPTAFFITLPLRNIKHDKIDKIM